VSVTPEPTSWRTAEERDRIADERDARADEREIEQEMRQALADERARYFEGKFAGSDSLMVRREDWSAEDCSVPDSTAVLRSGMRVSVLSIIWTVLASSVSIAIGVRASNLVLAAFGATGLMDAAGSAALVMHFRHAIRHETFSQRHERVALLVVTGGLLVVASGTIVVSVIKLVSGNHGESTAVGMGVAAASAVVLVVLARRKLTLGRAIPSQAMVADGWLSSTGAVLAVVAVLGTALSAGGWWWADPIAALVVAIGAASVGLTLARQT
jgi:divalent metal cation (Fe/Co/Zn/Cd) transporter